MMLRSINPYTEEVNWAFESFTLEECERYIERTRTAFTGWSSLSVERGSKNLPKVARFLERILITMCRNYYERDGETYQTVERRN